MKARRVKKLDGRKPLAENAARMIRVRLEELRSLAPAALEPGASDAQHDLRIAAKRLRYVLEVTELCFGRAAHDARRRARDLQEILGNLHDCDVMLPRVHAHLAELRSEDARTARAGVGDAPDLVPEAVTTAPYRAGSYRGLEVLAIFLEARRDLLFERFAEFWADQQHRGTWERLDRSMSRSLRKTGASRRSAGSHQTAEIENGQPVGGADTVDLEA
jgi:hypothetical protein